MTESRRTSRTRATGRVVDVAVVGAGAAGVGVGVALQQAGIRGVLLIDRLGVGASFDRWPAEMRFITPSFPTNSVGMLDLNAVAIGTSPAYTLEEEHPTGAKYAAYLRAVARHFRLKTRLGVDVESIAQDPAGFLLQTARGTLRARFVVWAAGEFQYPRLNPFPGAELCLHNSLIPSWSEIPGDEFLVIGGYESGVDAAVQLARRGKRVTILERAPTWASDDSDPSVVLSPYSQERLRDPSVAPLVRLAAEADVTEVRRRGQGHEVLCRGGARFRTRSQPVLATGFTGGHTRIPKCFELREDGFPRLTESDESTVCPGLFLVGPAVRHESHVFCFIYKFRQRFAVVARAIADRLGLDATELETYRRWGMYLDDLSCCGDECVC